MENKIISRITTKNYRNLVNEEGIELNNLNILIGSNGSGKSNFIAILEFLKNSLIPPSSDLESRGVTAFQDAISKFGNSNILNARMKKPAVVEFEFEFNIQISKSTGFKLQLELYVDKTINIINEVFQDINCSKTKQKLKTPFMYYFTCEEQSGYSMVSINNTNRRTGSHLEKIATPPYELALFAIPQLLTEKGTFTPEQVPLYVAHKELSDVVKKWQFYNANHMDLTKIREENPKIGLSDTILSKEGKNLITILDNLFNHTKYGIDFEERINNAMKEILPTLRRLKITREGMSLSIQWYFEEIETPFYLSEMSDGTVRMLCWAVILYSPILPMLLVIDEPELSLHIGWMRTLANWIKQASQKTQIIISTHSPDLLDYFTDCASNVICFDKAEQKGQFQAKKLPETILQEKIAEGWQLGDLYRVGDDIIGGWA